MELQSCTARRRAWIDSTRRQSTLEGSVRVPRLSSSAAADDVFTSGKIETWLEDCRSEVSAENTNRTFEFRSNSSCEELGLGSDAAELNSEDRRCGAGQPRRKHRLPSLNLGHSFASSCNSANTFASTSSVSELLHLLAENPETTLYELGFGSDEPEVAVRIPPRFFTFPSQAKGINFRLFLDAQLQRIREEDPSLCIASRFRQVQALTEMANAFYSLYSHVSRTPLQKLATPEFTFPSSPLERMERFRTSVRSEPKSPVERLKDTVAKMCLYTKSESCSPQASPRKSPVVVEPGGRAAKRLDFEGNDGGIERNSEDKEGFLEGGNLLSSLEMVIDVDLSPGSDPRGPPARATQDVVCPRIVETVHQEPFCCPSNTRVVTLNQRLVEESQPQNNSEESHDIPAQGWRGGFSRCSIFVTDEGHPPVQTCEESSAAGNIHYLNPPERRSPRPSRVHLQQVNSYELEEVNSAGEEDSGSSGLGRQLTRQQHRGKMSRGGSTHSDSSGYADEEASQNNRWRHTTSINDMFSRTTSLPSAGH